jgi:L-ascorbate metabolism protein UlaG (beta-lactamase superfamily)
MNQKAKRLLVAAAGCVLLVPAAALAQAVKITPLGSHDGEFCRNDRAMVFEDPDGTRILYDAGRTVRGGGDERLGEIDAVLLSHVHGDHLGDAHQSGANTGTCAEPDRSVADTPESNTVKITVEKGAKLLVGGEMGDFFANKIEKAGGTADQVQLVRFGGMREVGGMKVYSVPAVHSNGVSPDFLEGDVAAAMEENGLTAYVGPPGGYVLEFSNGLTVYLSGDTGQTAEQETVVRRRFGAELAVMNIGGVFSTGPDEAAWVIDELVQPNAVIASHANEAATENGQVKADSKTQAFIDATTAQVHVPLSGRTMEFDASGSCTAGCQ